MTVPAPSAHYLDTLSDTLIASGKWERWCAADDRLNGSDLNSVADLWRAGDRSTSCYLAVAALTELGSRRGEDDDDAALAVAVLIADGIAHLAHQLRDLCESDEVLAAVWEQVKRATPEQGPRAARYLLCRAKDQLLTGARNQRRARGEVHLDEMTSAANLEAAASESDPEAREELADLLAWAIGNRVVDQCDVDLILELVTVGSHPGDSTDRCRPRTRQQTLQLVGRRRGVVARTVARREEAVVRRLRAALPAYLADVS